MTQAEQELLDALGRILSVLDTLCGADGEHGDAAARAHDELADAIQNYRQDAGVLDGEGGAA